MLNSAHSTFLSCCLFFIFVSCAKIQNSRPPCEVPSVQFALDTSYLSTPLVIPMQLIEDKVNMFIRQDLFHDDDFENIDSKGKKDHIKIKITRYGPIKIHWKNNEATYQLPLHILLEREMIGRNILPISKSLALKTEFSLLLCFKTKIDVGSDWKLNTQSDFISFQWLSKVKILGGLINIQKIVESRIRKQIPALLQQLDQGFGKSTLLRDNMELIWRQIHKPIILTRKGALVSLKINPICFELSNIINDDKNLILKVRLSVTTETLLGEKPDSSLNSILPPLLKPSKLPAQAYLYILSNVPYQDIDVIINKKLKGEVFEIAGHHIKVKRAKMSGCGTDIILQLTVGGDVKGDIYFRGTPHFDQDSQRILIKNFDFEVNTEEMLLYSADWLLHSSFKAKIETQLNLPLSEQIESIPNAILKGIEKGKLGKKMEFFIEQWDFKPPKISVQSSGLAALLIVDAKINVTLESF